MSSYNGGDGGGGDEVDRLRSCSNHTVPEDSINGDENDDEGYLSTASSLHSQQTVLSGGSPSKPDDSGGIGGRRPTKPSSRRIKHRRQQQQPQWLRSNKKNQSRMVSVVRWMLMALVPTCLTFLQFAKMSSYLSSISAATTAASQELFDTYHWSMMGGENHAGHNRTSSPNVDGTTAAVPHPPAGESSLSSPRPLPTSATNKTTPATMLSTGRMAVTGNRTKKDTASTIGISPTTFSTLALLVPPGFIGGYRNQYLRFCSMVWYAKQQQSSSSGQQQQQQQLLLPSILWSTTYKSVQNERFFFPIPMKILFDVDHWNTYYPRLPRLVESNDLVPAPSSSTMTGTSHNTSSSSSISVDCWEDLDTNSGRVLLQSRRTQYMEEHKNLIARNSSSTETTNGNSTGTGPTKKSAIFFESPMVETLLKSSGYLVPIANESIDYYIGKRKDVSTVRKTDYSSRVQHCTNPKVIGGGKGAGILWNMWTNKIHTKLLQEQKQHENRSQAGSNTTSINVDDESGPNTKLFTLISQALRPHPKWRNVAHQCIHHHLRRQNNVSRADAQQQHGETSSPPYLALHARVEVDMMQHKCGKNMEKNLTRIFEMVDTFISNYNKNISGFRNEDDRSQQLQGTFVAVSRNSMKISTADKTISAFADNNWAVLNIRSPQQHQQENDHRSFIHDEGVTPVFECGEIWMDRWYNDASKNVVEGGGGDHNHHTDDLYGSIVPSIINFYIAVQATIFVGVDKSSWSTDVWTTRYHLGKGETNFRYTQHDGVIPVSNGGLPPPHKNC